MNAEERRLKESRERSVHWKRWGPYLSERQWGTVREDYSPHGTAWDYFPHDHARSRAYRWGEDGIAGICDRHGLVCFALSLWNGRDPILKERLFGLTGPEGNHGEDPKELYFYLESTPTHSYMKYLYKYPQAEFPYRTLVEENRRRGRLAWELELLDTGVFHENRYFDVFVEYAKDGPEDILIRIEAFNRGPETADIHLLPTIWFRNTWSWDAAFEGKPWLKPRLRNLGCGFVEVNHPQYGTRRLYVEGTPELLFTENNTNAARLFGGRNETRYVKDGINDCVVHGRTSAVNPEQTGTKAAAHYRLSLEAGRSAVLRLRFTPGRTFLQDFDAVFAQRRAECDQFFETIIPAHVPADAQRVMRQALAGMMWSKQFYHYDLTRWLKGDKLPAPPERRKGRNSDWGHLFNADVISMPDKWEYPWYAAWDLAFHAIPIALMDPDFAKEQLILMLREWYMHPNGQLPAYEWAFGDVNPPVHAWAAWRVYKIEKKRCGTGDLQFLERVFHKLLLNFNWWVNRKDTEGRNVFQGGFLGLDNIGVFDRSKPLPTGGHMEQSDATSWMGMYCLNLLTIALELAMHNPAYEDVASKFFEHFVYICRAMNDIGGEGIELWNDADGFFYDVLHLPDGRQLHMTVRSMVGLIPLFGVETLDWKRIGKLEGFRRRMQWFLDNRPEFGEYVTRSSDQDGQPRYLLSLVNPNRLRRVLRIMLDEREFLSDYGIRSLSRYHQDKPYRWWVNGEEHRVDYEPAESSSGLFGGNSNWRGPVWFPVNYLIVESLQKFHYYLGDDYKVEYPTGSGRMLTLWDVAAEISRRLTRIFLRGDDGKRPVFGGQDLFHNDPHWQDLVLFYEYFHGENGAGLGASHQTGWTGLVAKLIQQSGAGLAD